MKNKYLRLHPTDAGVRFLQGLPILDRIKYRLVRAGIDLEPGPCWPWPGARNAAGYGRMTSDRHGGETYVHRIMYREVRGQIPDGCEIDHLCRNRACCNPDHLEAVPRAENARRRRTDNVGDGMCAKGGHPFEPLRNGVRACRICYNARMVPVNRARRAAQRAARSATPPPDR